MKSFLAAVLLSAALAAPAAAQDMDHGAHGSAGRAFGAANQAMMKGMAMPMTGNVDQDFVSMMIVHHQGAIDMARVELQHGRDPQLRALAEEIVAAQEKEIALMKQWQAENPG